MKHVVVLLMIVLVTLIACEQTSPQIESNNDYGQYETEIKKKDSIINSLKAELDSLNAQKKLSHESLCFNSENELYGTIKPEKIDCPEFAKHLNWIDTTINYFNGDYNISITNSCNGPSDTNIEACNCSNNFYISTGSEDLPKSYDLFRVGPYRRPTNIQFVKKDQILRFEYPDKRNNIKTAAIKINRHSITVVK